MSTPRTPEPGKLVVSIIFRSESEGEKTEQVEKCLAELKNKFGDVDCESRVSEFTRTTYYYKEMGKPLFRVFVSFGKPVARDRLAEIKHLTNAIEKRFADSDGKRCLNIDPGLLTLENLVLASGKNFTHRIYLRDGIFAETTLLFQNKRFNDLPWTYPDYGSAEVKELLGTMRNKLIRALKASSQ